MSEKGTHYHSKMKITGDYWRLLEITDK